MAWVFQIEPAEKGGRWNGVGQWSYRSWVPNRVGMPALDFPDVPLVKSTALLHL